MLRSPAIKWSWLASWAQAVREDEQGPGSRWRKWVRKARAHVFECEAASRIDQILVTGEVAVPKDEFNFFPTPSGIVAKLVELADIEPGMRVLEPEAGQGAIALACVEAGAVVDCVELMEQNFAKLQAMDRFGSVRNMDF